MFTRKPRDPLYIYLKSKVGAQINASNTTFG